MQKIKVIGIPTEQTRAYREGALDANNMPPEHHVTAAFGAPCRHCLEPIEQDADMLVLAYRPFTTLQPYAEVGPIFLHGRDCSTYDVADTLPKMFNGWDALLVRGYGKDDRIRYETGQVVPINMLDKTCRKLLDNPDVAYLHIRSSQYNCYQCRVERA